MKPEPEDVVLALRAQLRKALFYADDRAVAKLRAKLCVVREDLHLDFEQHFETAPFVQADDRIAPEVTYTTLPPA